MMAGLTMTLRNYVRLGRISNLPTTLTNVFVGGAIASQGATMPWPRLIIAWSAIACFYVAGMALNDVVDEAIDRHERPSRPIPSGSITPRAATIFLTALFAAGLTILSVNGISAFVAGVALVLLIIAYNFLHAAFSGAVVLMGACRGMIYIVAAASIAPPNNWTVLGVFAGALMLYTILFSIIARSETQEQLGRRRWLSLLIPLVVIGPALASATTKWMWAIAPLAITIAWLARAAALVLSAPPRTRDAVMAWLAGFCLVDTLFLTLLNQPTAALLALACFAGTALAQRRVVGT